MTKTKKNSGDFEGILIRRCFDLTCLGGIIWLLKDGINMFSMGFSSILIFIYLFIGTEVERDLNEE